MGKVASRIALLNPFRNFNIEDRAHKVISQSKPVPAPKHKVDALNYEKILRDNPNIVEEAAKKNIVLDKNLRDVFVQSKDSNPEILKNPNRPLPLDRSTHEFEYGFKEPTKVPHGRVTLRNTLKFITDHQNNRKVETSEKISNDYLLPHETVQNILKYYKIFEVYVPVEKHIKARFAGPVKSRTKPLLEKIKVPLLTRKKDRKEDS